MRSIEDREEEVKQRGRGRSCATDLRALGAEGRYPNVLAVSHAFITDDEHKGKGVGRAMYEAMMVEGFAVRQSRIGGQPGPMFFIPDECSGAGNTSAEARRVWDSLVRDYPSQGTSIRVDAPPVIGSRKRTNPRRRKAVGRTRRTVSLAERGARLTAELRKRPHRVLPSRRRNPDPAEGLSDEMRWLWSSLHFETPQRRAEELAYQARWYLQQALEYDGDFDDLVERMEADEETDVIVAAINERDPNWLVRWHDDTGPEMMQHNASETPSFMFFDDPKVAKDGWWVHFTNDASDIARSGFAYGESDPMQLGLTTWKSKQAKRGPGYIFSFAPEEGIERNFGGWGYGTAGKYGREAVVFRADAVTAYHHGDEEDQVISWGPEAKDIHAVYFDGEHAPGLSGKHPPRKGIAGTYDDYEDVTFFTDLPTLIRYIEADKKPNTPSRSRR
jgi:hypothetical protein